MANTYTQIHIHVVFAVKFRKALIQHEWKDELYKYITGTIQSEGHKLLAVNGMTDHIHILFGQRPNQSLSDLMSRIKGHSSKWINEKGFTHEKFQWQEGYGAFSYEKTTVPRVIAYILNQDEHHRKQTFLEEYLDFLKTFEIDYDEAYIFHEPV
jgi:REP element-mobilizing transposase RayT